MSAFVKPFPVASAPKPRQADNLLAESAAIAALIWGDAGDLLTRPNPPTAADFTHESYRHAFGAITELVADSLPIDIPTLASKLPPNDLLIVEDACRAHVSAANFDAHVKLLKECRRAREAQSARDRLASAAAVGAPAHELAAILESIRASDQPVDSRPRLQWADEFCQSRPDEDWLIDQYIPASSVGLVFGDSEAWKSFLLIDMAAHIATGKPWRGREVKSGKVLFIAGEGGNGLRTRIKAWFERHGEPMRNFAVSTVPLELCDPKNADILISDIRRFIGDESFSFIVLDTLNTHFGAGDENATADMTRFRLAVLKLSQATGATVAIVHHCGHQDKTRSRGNISLHNGIDWEYKLERSGDYTTMTNSKMKDSAKPPPLSWTLVQQPLPWADSKGNPINGAVLEPSTHASTHASTRRLLTRQQRITLEVLDAAIASHGDGDSVLIADWRRVAVDAGITQSQSRQGKFAAFSRAVDALVDAGLVVVDGYRCRPSTRQQTSTNVNMLTNVDAGTTAVNASTLSTHPYRGVDFVDVDAKPQPASLNSQPTNPVNADDQFEKFSVDSADRQQASTRREHVEVDAAADMEIF